MDRLLLASKDELQLVPGMHLFLAMLSSLLDGLTYPEVILLWIINHPLSVKCTYSDCPNMAEAEPVILKLGNCLHRLIIYT